MSLNRIKRNETGADVATCARAYESDATIQCQARSEKQQATSGESAPHIHLCSSQAISVCDSTLLIRDAARDDVGCNKSFRFPAN